MPDNYASWSAAAMGTQGTKAVAITASATEFAATRAIHTNTATTITVQFLEETGTVDLVVAAGATYPYRIVKVTAGAGVVAIY